MAVVLVLNGIVVQTWRDVKTVQDAVDKYDLSPTGLHEANHPPGTQYDGTVFYTPIRPPAPVEPESDVVLALRDLADELSPRAAAKMVARFGPRR